MYRKTAFLASRFLPVVLAVPLSGIAYFGVGKRIRWQECKGLKEQAQMARVRRKPVQKEDKETKREAAIWVSDHGRINKARGILACCNFFETPVAPCGEKNNKETLFGWIANGFADRDRTIAKRTTASEDMQLCRLS
jgi:hypothetical protein